MQGNHGWKSDNAGTHNFHHSSDIKQEDEDDDNDSYGSFPSQYFEMEASIMRRHSMETQASPQNPAENTSVTTESAPASVISMATPTTRNNGMGYSSYERNAGMHDMEMEHAFNPPTPTCSSAVHGDIKTRVPHALSNGNRNNNPDRKLPPNHEDSVYMKTEQDNIISSSQSEPYINSIIELENDKDIIDDNDNKKYGDLVQDSESQLDLSERELSILTQSYMIPNEDDHDLDNHTEPPPDHLHHRVSIDSVQDGTPLQSADGKEPPTVSKRRKCLGNPTLTQFDGFESSRSSSSPSVLRRLHTWPRLEDNRARVFHEHRLFIENETFQFVLKGTNCIVRLAEFGCIQQRKVARCSEVYIDIQDTFLGREMAELLRTNETWRAVNQSKDKMIWKQRSDLWVPVKNLGERVTLDATPECVYENNPDQEKHAEGFNVSFTFPGKDQGHLRKIAIDHPILMELFAGAGGSALGFCAAGMIPKYAVDQSPDAISTLERNESHFQVRGHDVLETYQERVDVFMDKCSNNAQGYPQPGEVDHIHASPPCQGFSAANRNGGTNDRCNNEASYEFVKAVKFFRPTTASLENVTGMLHKDNRSYPERIITDLLLLNYQVRIFIANAKDYGDPQSRSRVWIVAALPTVELPAMPVPVPRKLRIREALQPLADVSPVPGNGRVFVDGVKVDDHRIEETASEPPATATKEFDRLSQCVDDFARTVRCQRPIKHHTLNRFVTVRERATLQSFPYTYKFSGTPAQQRQLIGNAVPVHFATVVAQSVMKSYQPS